MDDGGAAMQRPDDIEEPAKGVTEMRPLPPDDRLYRAIQADFQKVGLTVQTVDRVTNHHLYQVYTTERKQFLENRIDKDPKFDINERYLYHGTNNDKEVFKEEEIDNRLSNGGCFGNGIYFSDNPLKSAKYADKGTKEKLILLERVILGESKVYRRGEQDRGLKREPRRENPGRGPRRYDSVEGRPTKLREFVIYERRRALVECIITFTRNPTPGGDAQPADLAADLPAGAIRPGEPDTDSDSDTTSDEDEVTARPENDDEDTTTDDEDYTDAKDKTDDESDGTEFQDALSRIPHIGDEELQTKVREFMEKTKEKDMYIAKFYVVMENYSVDIAIKKYNEPVSFKMTKEEEEEADRLVAELEKELCQPGNIRNFESLPQDEKDTLMPQLIVQFCKICGLDKDSQDGKSKAQKHLDQSKWETDMAILNYFEEMYDIRR